MNKKEILEKLKELPLDKEKVIIISGASLVLQDILKTTSDIDLSCDEETYKQIPWPEKPGYFKIPIKYYREFEIGFNLYNPTMTIQKYGYHLANLEYNYQIKCMENKKKDEEIRKKLKERLEKKKNKEDKKCSI